MAMDFLLQQVKDAIYKDPNTNYQQGDSHGLIGQVEGLFGGLLGGGGQQSNNAPGSMNNPLPASQDRYGDPADMENNPEALRRQYPGLKDASQDPYGDPADREPQGGNANDLRQQFPNLKSASEDPYGDPADQR